MKTFVIIINLIVLIYLIIGAVRTALYWNRFASAFDRLYYALFWLLVELDEKKLIKTITHCYEEGGASRYISKDSYIAQVLEMLEEDISEERIRQACRTIDYIYTFKPTINGKTGRR